VAVIAASIIGNAFTDIGGSGIAIGKFVVDEKRDLGWLRLEYRNQRDDQQQNQFQ
jgi:hypothetical protein